MLLRWHGTRSGTRPRREQTPQHRGSRTPPCHEADVPSPVPGGLGTVLPRTMCLGSEPWDEVSAAIPPAGTAAGGGNAACAGQGSPLIPSRFSRAEPVSPAAPGPCQPRRAPQGSGTRPGSRRLCTASGSAAPWPRGLAAQHCSSILCPHQSGHPEPPQAGSRQGADRERAGSGPTQGSS